jgi:hypothetical protein
MVSIELLIALVVIVRCKDADGGGDVGIVRSLRKRRGTSIVRVV